MVSGFTMRKHSIILNAGLAVVMVAAGASCLTSAAQAGSKRSNVKDISVTKQSARMQKSSTPKKAGHLTVRKAGKPQPEF